VRVRVEVEQRARALDRGREIADVIEREACGDVALGGGELDDSGADRQAEAASVHAVLDRLDARHGSQPKEIDQTGSVERRAIRKAERDAAVGRVVRVDPAPAGPARLGPTRPRPARPGAQHGGRHREHVRDGVVELANAAKSRGECHVRHRQLR
jgi:hypothetical protein